MGLAAPTHTPTLRSLAKRRGSELHGRDCRGIQVRVSIGSLARLGIARIRAVEEPTTLYMLQYSPGGCLGSCLFCSQARGSFPERLSRITWPRVSLGEVLNRLHESPGVFERLCFQTVLKPGFAWETLCIAKLLTKTGMPVSVAITPVHRGILEELHAAGVERLGVGLDAATPSVAARVAKPYPWRIYMEFIRGAVEVFGGGRVHVHLVAGLGETPRDMLRTMKRLYAMGAKVALFRYTPVPGRPRLPGIGVAEYRALQLARLLLEHGLDPEDYLDFTASPPRALRRPPLSPGDVAGAFLTSGCPGCNRPFYNESPRGPIYNYPSPRMLSSQLEVVKRQLEELGAGDWLQ